MTPTLYSMTPIILSGLLFLLIITGIWKKEVLLTISLTSSIIYCALVDRGDISNAVTLIGLTYVFLVSITLISRILNSNKEINDENRRPK